MTDKTETCWGIKYSIYTKVPFEEKVGTGNRWTEKEGWTTVEYWQVGAKNIEKRISDKSLKAIDESIGKLSEQTNISLENMEIYFRENPKITETREQKAEREKREAREKKEREAKEAKMQKEQDKLIASRKNKSNTGQKLLENVKGAKE